MEGLQLMVFMVMNPVNLPTYRLVILRNQCDKAIKYTV